MKFQLERVLLFSDAVFAIAITLMIIEIKPPHLPEHISFIESLQIFSGKSLVIIGTILSFYLIGFFWYKHHDLMKHLVACDAKFIRMNLSLLLAIAFIPFSTAFVFENAPSPFTLLVYNINYIMATLLNYRVYNYALNPSNHLCQSDITEDISHLKKETLYACGVYTFIAILAFFTPVAPAGYALFAFQEKIVKPKKK
jgi:uncharacterized membrane protein